MNAIFLTDKHLLDTWWDRAAVHFQPVVNDAAHGEFTVSDIRRLCEENRSTCAVVVEGEDVILAIAFEYIFYPRMTACNIMAVGGSRLSAIKNQFFVTFTDWCKSVGITVIEASCSSVMSRLLRRYGFAKTYEVVRFNL